MIFKNALLVAGMLLAILPAAALAQPIDPKVQARIDRILKATPLIDGHNDLAEELRENYGGKTEGLASGTDAWKPQALMTDIARLHAGRVGGQFWSVFIPAEIEGDAAIRTIENRHRHRMIADYPEATGGRRAVAVAVRRRPGDRRKPHLRRSPLSWPHPQAISSSTIANPRSAGRRRIVQGLDRPLGFPARRPAAADQVDHHASVADGRRHRLRAGSRADVDLRPRAADQSTCPETPALAA